MFVIKMQISNLLYTMHVLFLVFKQINVYLCIFTIVWHLDIKRLMVGILLISLILYLCACSKPGTMISSAFFILFFMLTVNQRNLLRLFLSVDPSLLIFSFFNTNSYQFLVRLCNCEIIQYGQNYFPGQVTYQNKVLRNCQSSYFVSYILKYSFFTKHCSQPEFYYSTQNTKCIFSLLLNLATHQQQEKQQKHFLMQMNTIIT